MPSTNSFWGEMKRGRLLFNVSAELANLLPVIIFASISCHRLSNNHSFHKQVNIYHQLLSSYYSVGAHVFD